MGVPLIAAAAPTLMEAAPFVIQGLGALASGIGMWKQGSDQKRIAAEQLEEQKKQNKWNRNMTALNFLAQQRERAVSSMVSTAWQKATEL